MKCLVWNMDYWKSSKKEESWSYVQSLDPDVSLLNECSTHNSQKNHIHHIAKDKWGCGVFSKHTIQEVVFDKSHPDAIACGQVTINDQPITLVSLYGKIIDGYSITTLHRSLSDLTHLFIQSDIRDWLLIGGDFNADVALDERQPGKSHHLFFERLKDFGLKDCREKFNSERVQTLRHKKSTFAWQNDYLFAGKKIYDKCTSCQVIDDESLYELSDHNPIVAEFDLSTIQLRLLRI